MKTSMFEISWIQSTRCWRGAGIQFIIKFCTWRKILFFSVACLIFSYLSFWDRLRTKSPMISQSTTDFLISTPIRRIQDSHYFISTSSCRIPDYNREKRLAEHRKESHLPPFRCSEDSPLVSFKERFIENNSVAYMKINVQENTSYRQIECCVNELYRDGDSDNAHKYSNSCLSISSDYTPLPSAEFYRVTCKQPNNTKTYKDFFAMPILKPEVEKRCSHSNKERLPSILVIVLDTVPKSAGYLYLNKSLSTLQAVKEPNGQYRPLIELAGYTKVGHDTFPNIIPLLTGFSEEELIQLCFPNRQIPMDNCQEYFLWSQVKRFGYRTAYAEDENGISTFNYIKKGFCKQPTDYYLRPLIRAALIEAGAPRDGNVHPCLKTKPQIVLILDWLRSFLRKFSGKTYFAYVFSNSITHDSYSRAQYVDPFMVKLFRDAITAGYLNNTVLFYLSDHGPRWGSIRETLPGTVGSFLPMSYMSLPSWFPTVYPKSWNALKINSKRLTTPYDIHETIIEMSHGLLESTHPLPYRSNSTPRGISVFREIPENRTCKDASIPDNYCPCYNFSTLLPYEMNTALVRHSAAMIVDKINEITSQHREKCATLRLERILSVRLTTFFGKLNDEEKSETVLQLLVTLRTIPGYGHFEALTVGKFVTSKEMNIVTISNTFAQNLTDTVKLKGEVIRTSLYGNQSKCVNDDILRKYCYCNK